MLKEVGGRSMMQFQRPHYYVNEYVGWKLYNVHGIPRYTAPSKLKKTYMGILHKIAFKIHVLNVITCAPALTKCAKFALQTINISKLDLL